MVGGYRDIIAGRPCRLFVTQRSRPNAPRSARVPASLPVDRNPTTQAVIAGEAGRR